MLSVKGYPIGIPTGRQVLLLGGTYGPSSPTITGTFESSSATMGSTLGCSMVATARYEDLTYAGSLRSPRLTIGVYPYVFNTYYSLYPWVLKNYNSGVLLAPEHLL